MQDPEVYLSATGVSLACPVHRDRDAVLDVEHRVRIGHEVFFFSSADALAEFLGRPLRYLDRLTDPVTLERFEPTEYSPVENHLGRSYYFSNEETLIAFRNDPAKYDEPRMLMR